MYFNHHPSFLPLYTMATEACVICLDDISEGCQALPCGHAYDYLCLLSWLELRQTCPLCNGQVESIKVQQTGQVRFPHTHTYHIADTDYDSRLPLRDAMLRTIAPAALGSDVGSGAGTIPLGSSGWIRTSPSSGDATSIGPRCAAYTWARTGSRASGTLRRGWWPRTRN